MLRLTSLVRGLSLAASLAIAFPLLAQDQATDDWKPVEGKLMTKWAAEVSPENPLPEYPRPQLVRDEWQSLNGLWDYRIEKLPTAERGADPQAIRSGKILVPFPLESALSGVGGKLMPDEKLIYEREFTIPFFEELASSAFSGEGPFDRRVRLHFGAVDWKCSVYVDDVLLGVHGGGYDSFHFDIFVDPFGVDEAPGPNPYGNPVPKKHRLRVEVWDPTDAGHQPVGKQSLNPHGIWYTAVSGIWQTVWIEPLPDASIDSLDIVTKPADDGSWTATITPKLSCSIAEGQVVEIQVIGAAGKDLVITTPSISAQAAAGQPIEVKIPEPKLWSPDEPWLYQFRADVYAAPSKEGEKRGPAIDSVKSYFGLREVKLAVAEDGHRRIFLNGKPLFQFGMLDQGWWPDGLYTAPTDEALEYDVLITKQLGFNMARKHVKVEPARWYWHCDRLGLLVWQDMPSGDDRIGPDAPDIKRSAQSELAYRREWSRIIDCLDSHPSIVAWVPFNEGWGQFKTNEILAWTKSLDPTRLVDGPSGWADRGEGDLIDMHRYPGPGMFDEPENRASVLGEFGGLGLPVPGHLWVEQNNWGYRTYKTPQELEENYRRVIGDLRPLIANGLAAAVYTQTTDVEIEVNGLLTYDRAVVKLPENIRELHQTLYEAPPKISEVLPTSEKEPRTWSYSFDEAAPQGWQTHDAGSWKQGPGGFGTEGTPNSVVRTTWDGPQIRVRQEFELSEVPAGRVAVRMFHDEDAVAYLNGKKILSVADYTDGYRTFSTSIPAKDVLKQGKNVLAIECKQTQGGQFIDAGILVVGE
ncbi:MAG TPA: glycoside hydrolase family 2 TIM barrel-domain containing protein [Pirellulaceae bacterium]|jgi:hypothetical protein|nr:glycoside hydrolase family 2 TIM barrel-domain containing protein [Pirellulaceae bacterium]